ncbi:MAG: cobyric acid synthase [Thiohalomonadales bacterium]
MTATALMIQGTTSDAGKTAFVTGLCRLLTRQGYSVAPFKPQNMALNSAVTQDGGEIGRAQALQAKACGIPSIIDMNPVLLKPNSDTGSQVIVQGHAIGNMDAKSYHSYKPILLNAVLDSYHRLCKKYDIIIIEGAGSPAEINLRENDIANMGFAEAINCPVILIADIERGGVFAHLLGTLKILSESERNRILGLVINRFRGDLNILQPGVDWLEQKCQKPVLGVLPYLKNLHLEAEDSLNIQNSTQAESTTFLRIIVPKLPKMSNHTDFDALRLHPQVDLQFISEQEKIPAADLIIIPGSKSVRSDLDWLITHGWKSALQKHCRYGGKLIGICGGFQMLGSEIRDPDGIESNAGTSTGLEFLEMVTELQKNKTLKNRTGKLVISKTNVSGYEIHCGITYGTALNNPAVVFNDSNDGVLTPDGIILGTYLHGLFDSESALTAILKWAGLDEAVESNYQVKCEDSINRLADVIEQCVGMDVIYRALTPALSQRERELEL